MNVVYNMDCMEYMRTLPDKAFDLAVVDPPYGIGMDGGVIGGSVLAKNTAYTKKQWDARPPSPEYFLELDRVSRNQIIWGAITLSAICRRKIPRAGSFGISKTDATILQTVNSRGHLFEVRSENLNFGGKGCCKGT